MRNDGGSPFAWLALAAVGICGMLMYGFLASELGPGFAIPVGIVGAITTAAVLTGPVGKALAQRLGLQSPPPPGEVPDQVLGELDDLRVRMQELEERVDFSERLLAQQPRAGSAPER